MRAYVLEDIAKAELKETPRPEPGPGEVLTRVRTSSLNPHDDHVLQGYARAYLEYDLPAIIGSDVAGEVEAVGEGVTSVAVGDRVFGLERSQRVHAGTFAEYAVLPEASVVKTPKNVDDASAGALGLAALMAVTAIDAAELAPGQTLLINGATGGVGCYTTQLATAAGARVLATARPGSESDLVSGFGAVQVIDWSSEDVAGVAKNAGGVDVVLDLVNSDSEAADKFAQEALASSDGRSLVTLVPDGKAQFLMAVSSPELLQRIAKHAADGELKAPVTSSYELSDIEAAFAALRAGAVGKIGLRVD